MHVNTIAPGASSRRRHYQRGVIELYFGQDVISRFFVIEKCNIFLPPNNISSRIAASDVICAILRHALNRHTNNHSNIQQ